LNYCLSFANNLDFRCLFFALECYLFDSIVVFPTERPIFATFVA